MEAGHKGPQLCSEFAEVSKSGSCRYKVLLYTSWFIIQKARLVPGREIVWNGSKGKGLIGSGGIEPGEAPSSEQVKLCKRSLGEAPSSAQVSSKRSAGLEPGHEISTRGPCCFIYTSGIIISQLAHQPLPAGRAQGNYAANRSGSTRPLDDRCRGSGLCWPLPPPGG